MYPFLRKVGGGIATGVYVNFFFTGLPFLLLNISRSLYKGKRGVDVLNISYIVVILVYGLFVLNLSDWLIMLAVYIPFISFLTMESFQDKVYPILNIMSIGHLLFFLMYVTV
jgi:cation transport ATPase